MQGYNNYIDLNKNRIYNYEISLLFGDRGSIEENNQDKINFITDVSKLFWRVNKYIPSSQNIIDVINKLNVRDLRAYDSYIQSNKSKFVNHEIQQIDDNCLVTICIDEIDKDWLLRNSNIFKKIYIISYKKYEVNLKNVEVIYSKNDVSNSVIDILLFSIDIKSYFKKIFFLDNSQNIGILNGKDIELSTDIIHNYIKNLKVLKSNYLFCKNFISINSSFYEIKKNNYFLANGNFFNFVSSSEVNTSTKSTIKTPLVLINNICNSTFINESYLFISSIYKDNIYKLEGNNIFQKYVAENRKTLKKKSEEEIIEFFKNKYKVDKFEIDKSKSMTIKQDNIFSPYDYQFYDNSIIVDLKFDIETDLLLLCYIYSLSIEFNKKMFVIYDEKYNDNVILEDYFYKMSDCDDNIKTYKVNGYTNTHEELIILSNDVVSYVSVNNLNFDNRFFEKIKDIFLKLKWSVQINTFLRYIIKDCGIDLNKIVTVDIDEKYYHILENIIDYNQKNIILFNKPEKNIDNFKYSIIPLKKDNNLHATIKLILLYNSVCFINDNDIMKKNYKIMFYKSNIFDVKKLLYSSECLAINNFDGTIDKIFKGIQNKHICKNSRNGISFILTNDKNINNKLIDKLADISYVDEIFIISSPNSKISYKSYKVKKFKSKYTTCVTLNNLVKYTQYDKIIISDFVVNTYFFKLHSLNGNNFFVNKSRTFCYFDIIQFKQLNGFHQDSLEFIYNFGLRLEENEFNKMLINSEFDKSNKQFLRVDKNLKIWNKESEQLKVNIKRHQGVYFLI